MHTSVYYLMAMCLWKGFDNESCLFSWRIIYEWKFYLRVAFFKNQEVPYSRVSLCLSVSLSLCIFVSVLCLSVSLSLCRLFSLPLSASLPLCLLCLPSSLCLCLSIPLSLCLFVSLSLCPYYPLSLSPFLLYNWSLR